MVEFQEFHSNTKKGIQGHMNFPCPLGIRNYTSSDYPSQILLLYRDLGCIPNRNLVNKSHSIITNQLIWLQNFHQYQHIFLIENNQYNFSCVLLSLLPLFWLVILQAAPADLAPLHRSQGQTRRLSFKETRVCLYGAKSMGLQKYPPGGLTSLGCKLLDHHSKQ